MAKLHIKKNDMVRVITGKEKGAEGRVMEVFPAKQRAIVEGVNVRIKHQKPNQENPEGARVNQEMSIHISNLMLLDPATKEPTRIGRKRTENGKGWVRYSKKTGEIIP